ncbi:MULTISPECIES: type II toxin-antitoxin system Phd/YefM family antitoxin [unclassified Brevundimonas]|uniref:type II toxin-antitoxin system Phd/YefM family antitoxin n=1 Tax=unclassified Brevundimonas TaxID=2622653 RepID=UPI003F8E918E
MREIGVLEAKTSFTRLIAEVERTGEVVTVTRHGRAAVRIVPVQTPSGRAPGQRAAAIRELLRRRDARPVVEGFDDLDWPALKRIGRDEDRHG